MILWQVKLPISVFVWIVSGIPFKICLDQPNNETIAAMLEAERIAKDPSVKGYDDLDELFADLKK